jgi:hypothetical protein
MAPAWAAGSPRDGPISTGFEVAQAFPSPASTTASLDTPTLNRSIAGPKQPWTPRSLLPDAANILPTEPTAQLAMPEINTPLYDSRTQPDMDIVVGGALAPVHKTLPERPARKAGPGLRLPSFEDLGIAAPHPDRFGQQQSLDGSAFDSFHEMASHSHGQPQVDTEMVDCATAHPTILSERAFGVEGDVVGGRAIQSPVQQFIATLTPPAELGEMSWSSMAAVTNVPIESPVTDPGPTGAPSPVNFVSAGVEHSAALPAALAQGHISEANESWVAGALDAIRKSTRGE